MPASFIPSILDELDDVGITTPSVGQVIRHNGTNFVNAQLAHTDLSGIGTLTHAQIDSYLDQAVKTTSSPIFDELTIRDLGVNSTPWFFMQNDAQQYRMGVNGADTDNFGIWDATSGWYQLLYYTPSTRQLSLRDGELILLGGRCGLGISPTAVLHLKAGAATASNAPLKFAAGTNLTALEAGAMEFSGTDLFITDSTPTRHGIISHITDASDPHGATLTQTNLNVINALGINTSSPTASSLHATNEAGSNMIYFDAYGTSAPIIVSRKALGSIASPTAVTTDTKLAGLQAHGYTGSFFGTNPQADINMYAAEDWNSTNRGTYMTFSVTPKLSTTKTEVFRIRNRGELYFPNINWSATTIDLCETAWTESANVTATVSTTKKEGTYSSSIAFGAGFTTGKAAYDSFVSPKNLSAYHRVFFWIRSNMAISAGVLTLRLCSDTTGDVTVDTIAIPAIPTINTWQEVTVDLTTKFGSAIQSIALYAESDPGTPTILIDQIVAQEVAYPRIQVSINCMSELSSSIKVSTYDDPDSINSGCSIWSSYTVQGGMTSGYNTGIVSNVLAVNLQGNTALSFWGIVKSPSSYTTGAISGYEQNVVQGADTNTTPRYFRNQASKPTSIVVLAPDKHDYGAGAVGHHVDYGLVIGSGYTPEPKIFFPIYVQDGATAKDGTCIYVGGAKGPTTQVRGGVAPTWTEDSDVTPINPAWAAEFWGKFNRGIDMANAMLYNADGVAFRLPNNKWLCAGDNTAFGTPPVTTINILKVGTDNKILFGADASIGGAAVANARLTVVGQYFSKRYDNGNSGASLTVNWANSNVQHTTLTAACTLSVSNGMTGGRYILFLKQDATGSRTVTWWAGILWSGGTAPTLTTTANKTDIITFVFDGTNWFGSFSLNY